MTVSPGTDFLYLNLDNRWLGFQRHLLDLGKDGTLQLAHVPRLESEAPAELAGLPLPDAPAGVAVGPDGAVYYTDPLQHVLMRVDACDGRHRPAPCVGGVGDAPGRFHLPRGVVYYAQRNAFAVVDSANHRVQLLDAASFQVSDVWGGWGDAPGRFQTPWTAACDVHGHLYVLDFANRRVQQFDTLGRVQSAFWSAVAAEAQGHGLALSWPTDVAVAEVGGQTVVYILDARAGTAYAFGPDGQYLHVAAGTHGNFPTPLDRPMGLAAHGEALYVGENGRRRILRFTREGALVGAALGYDGPLAALAVDGRGGLLAHTGAGTPPSIALPGGGYGRLGELPVLRLLAAGGHGNSGFAWRATPLENPAGHAEQWHRVTVRLDAQPDDGSVKLYVYCAPQNRPPVAPEALGVAPWSLGTTSVRDLADALAQLPIGPEGQSAWVGKWLRVPAGAPATLVPGWPGVDLWIGFELAGDGPVSPVVDQIKVEFDHPTWLKHLPAVFQAEDRSRALLARFLTLFEGAFDELEAETRGLPERFDAEATPAAWLEWLASWLALDLNEDWPPALKRRVIAQAYALYGRRGTAAGLRDMVRLITGAEVQVTEPIAQAGWWCLPPEDAASAPELAQSVLGFGTALVAAEAQGAVVGTTAMLDESHLIRGDEYGAPLFQDLAHRFSVSLYRGAHDSAELRQQVIDVLERERPAHTAYDLCVIEPMFRIGFQAVLGIDTVVAGPPSPTPIEDPGTAAGLTLAGDPASRIGTQSRLGRTARLSG